MSPHPCFVCNSPANECHFGSKSQICRACSAFFRRYVLSPKSAIKCRKDKSCRIFFKDPKICRFCRMERCILAGMKTSAVQPPREKYSEDKSDSSETSSCYSGSPFTYEVQSCSTDIPRLHRLSVHFKNLEIVRKLEFQNQEPPKSRNMVELIEILRKDIRLVSTFVEGAYPEMGRMGKMERKLLFLNFFIRYMLVEPPFLGLAAGKKDLMLPNGDHYEEDISQFYSMMNVEAATGNTTEAVFKPYWDEYKRTVIDDVWFLKPDVYEFLTVSGLILWDTGLDGLTDQGVEVCRAMREKLVGEIHFYYKNVKKVEDPCLRLGQIMMLLSSVQKSFGKYQEELQMCGFFEIYKNLDPETCQIINESLQL